MQMACRFWSTGDGSPLCVNSFVQRITTDQEKYDMSHHWNFSGNDSRLNFPVPKPLPGLAFLLHGTVRSSQLTFQETSIHHLIWPFHLYRRITHQKQWEWDRNENWRSPCRVFKGNRKLPFNNETQIQLLHSVYQCEKKMILEALKFAILCYLSQKSDLFIVTDSRSNLQSHQWQDR